MRIFPIEPEALIKIMESVPLGTDWKLLRYAYVVSAIRRIKGKRKQVAEAVKISPRNLYNDIKTMVDLGFDV